MNKKSLLSGILMLAMCASLITGATFALFTSETQTNVAVTSGNVEVIATLKNLEIYSPKLITLDGKISDATNIATTTFSNGGTAQLDGATLKLDRMVPGDKATFYIEIENKSNVAIKWQKSFEVMNDTGLFDGLVVKIDDETFGGDKTESAWETVDAGKPITPNAIKVSVELPAKTGNTYKSKSCEIVFAINAVQGNTYVKSAVISMGETTYDTFEEAYIASSAEGGTKQLDLLADTTFSGANYSTNKTPLHMTIDLKGKTLTLKKSMSIPGDFYGGNSLTIKDSVGGGKVVFLNNSCIEFVNDWGDTLNIEGGIFIKESGSKPIFRDYSWDKYTKNTINIVSGDFLGVAGSVVDANDVKTVVNDPNNILGLN